MKWNKIGATLWTKATLFSNGLTLRFHERTIATLRSYTDLSDTHDTTLAGFSIGGPVPLLIIAGFAIAQFKGREPITTPWSEK